MFLGLVAQLSLNGAAPSWDFEIQHLGRVLYEGGWYQEYNLGTINASPEFSFPLELIYLNTRETSGMFGAQWYCPQLESTVIPQGTNQFNWQMPSGNVEPFRPDPVDPSRYKNPSGDWLAKVSSDRWEIWNEDGWTFDYDHARLQSVKSPTGRLLEFVWNGAALQAIQIVDSVTGKQRTLLQAVCTGTEDRIADLIYNGIEQQFTYEDGVYGRLHSWTPPTKDGVYFAYAPQGVLAQVQPESGKGEIVTFTTTLTDTQLSIDNQKDPAKWWLIEDPENKYTYVGQNKKNAVLVPGKFSGTSKTGLTESVDFDPRTAILTETIGGLTRVTAYYRAPAQSYNGRVKTIQENGLLKAEYDYDPDTGLLSATTDANGIVTNFDYPPNWERTEKSPWPPKPIRVWRGSAKNPEVLAQIQYDNAGRVIASQDEAGQVTKYSYDSRGELGSVTPPDKITISIAYDNFGRCVQATLGDQTTSVEYDDQGRIISRTGPDGTKMSFTYDEMGNLVQTLRNGKPVVDYLRDSTGKITGEKDALGRVHRIDSDSHGNVLAEYAPDGSVSKYEYDQFGRRTAQIDGNGNKVSFSYDGASHIVKQVNALGDTLKWDYDDENRLTDKDNGIQHITYKYDDNGRMVSTDYGSGQVLNCSYDDHGRAVSMVTPDSAFYYIYNSLGQVDALRVLCGSDEQLLRFRYDYAGNRTGLILARLDAAVAPAGGKIGYDAHYEVLQQIEYNYDERRRLSSIVSNGQSVISYKYDSGGRVVSKTFGNGIMASISYDAAGRLASMIFAGGPIEVPLTLTYQWDAADQVLRRSWEGEVQRYEYDLAGRLSKVFDDKTGKVNEAYVYDKAGNIIEKTIDGEKTTMTYNAANELVSSTGPDGTYSYTYDKAGRLVGPPKKVYGWLDKVIQTVSPTGAPIGLTYWPDGQLAAEGPTSKDISKVAYQPDSGGETFLWDGLALLRRDNVIYIAEPHPSGGATVASHPIGSKEMTYYINDLLGTTLAVVRGGAIEYNHLTSFGQMRKNNLISIQPQPITPPASVPAAPTPPSQPAPTSN